MIKLLEMLGFRDRAVTDVKQREAILSIQRNDTFVSIPVKLLGKSIIYLLYLIERIKGGVLIYLNSSLNIIVIVK